MIQNIMDDQSKAAQFAFDSLFRLKNPATAKNYNYTSAYTTTRHNHDYPQLWYCLDGEYQHRISDQLYLCKKGSLVVIPPGVFHRFYVPEGSHVSLWRINIRYDIFLNTPPQLYMNAITGMFLSAFEKEVGWRCPEYTQLSPTSAEIIDECVLELSMMELSPQPAAPERCCQILDTMFSLPELAVPQQYQKRAVRAGQTRMRPIVRALDYLNNNYTQQITAQKLQQVCAMCQREFFRSFKLFTGFTYSVYLQRLRVFRASEYMTFTQYPFSFIADICGFSDQAHMTNCFKKYEGRTPKQKRAIMQEYCQKHPDYTRKVQPF